MHKRFLGSVVAAVLIAGFGAVAEVRAADEYSVDPVHSSVTFKISHLGLAWIHGRFNDYSGTFTIDPNDAAKSAFSLTIKTETVDTNNAKRDEHLRAGDFFNVKQFPAMTFKSTSVKAVKDGYEVKGDLTLHGITKEVSFVLSGGKTAEFPKGMKRIGFSTDLKIKRSEFGIDQMLEALSDEVQIAISLEGTKK